MTADLRLADVEHQFGDFTALHPINLEIEAGEFIVLLGPSGCGKTTLLSIIGGFFTPSRGRVEIGGRDVTQLGPRDRPTTTMFQDYALFPHMSLRDNVAFGLRMRGIGKKERRQKANAMLDMVGLADKGDRKPHALSGGQRQRVALARALAVDPQVLLLDEPLGALDLKLRRQMQEELKDIQRRVGTTFIHVTHDQEEAMAIADRIVVMNQGRIEHCGTPEDVYLAPKTRFSADFMGEMNYIDVTATAAGVSSRLGPLALNGPDGTLCLRPENIGLEGNFSLGMGQLVSGAFFGAYHRCHFRSTAAPDIEVIAHLPQGNGIPIGAEVELFGRHPVIFPKDAA